MTNYSIRNHLIPGDLSKLANLHAKIYFEEHGFEIGFEAYVMESVVEFFRQYDPNLDRVWIVEENEVIVGFVLLMHRPQNEAQLRYFILEKSHRGKGIGSKLMQEWMDFFREKNYRSAYLYTTSGLDPAIHLYEKHGFKKISEQISTDFGIRMLEMYYRLDQL
ncbi:GNAT family N-acetyltransferase [Algoriphagus sanaruensis]|uniref:GCN5 family acetyltransferase n=1 Tax=Algoriphagus sanaruensis TaxID=1727163 RepID=A0A142EIN8_9BACT|nr:GNAT family N-acetyltransferase [Algoriphagus sanaruensis]AMQ54993.1 GCN5 family acetyltransferase [Algoriphagus sanaruensis]